MLTQEESRQIDEYVEGLRDGFREHLSDEDLARRLKDELEKSDSGRDSRYYFAGCAVFERYLECERKAGGNGHHQAQAFHGFMTGQET